MTSTTPYTELDVVRDLAHRAEQVHRLDADDILGSAVYDVPCGVGQGRRIEVLDLEQHLPQPRAKTGHVQLLDPDSFNRYVHAHSTGGTYLYADPDGGRVVAVLDDHAGDEVDGPNGEPGWGRHRATLGLKVTPEWQHWLSRDGRWVDQASFAEHLEDGITAITDPPPAELLEACRTLSVSRSVNFSSADRPTSGEIRFVYEETDATRAGKRGEVELPEFFAVALAPWRGCEPVVIQARLRYRLQGGSLSLSYRLARPEQAKEEAFDQVLTTIETGTGLTPLLGTPRSS